MGLQLTRPERSFHADDGKASGPVRSLPCDLAEQSRPSRSLLASAIFEHRRGGGEPVNVSLDEKTIAVVGVTDEETAHLRLLMRRAASELSHVWKWGSESNADLLVVDPSSFSGQMARTRAQSGGMRCAIFSDDPAIAGTELALHRPLNAANIIDVLNRAARMAERSEGIVPQKQDFWTREIG